MSTTTWFTFFDQLRSAGPSLGSLMGTPVATTPRKTVWRHGPCSLFSHAQSNESENALPVLLLPSLINRSYVFDLCEGYSLFASLHERGLRPFLFDWGVADESERHTGIEEQLWRIDRAMSFVRTCTKQSRVAIVGYSVGGTLATCWSAVRPEHTAALVNIAGPIDFAQSGALRSWVDPQWFSPRVIASAGNIPPEFLLSSFAALQPRVFARESMAGLRSFWNHRADPHKRVVAAMAQWTWDGVPFPARTWAEWIELFYQSNVLLEGEFSALGTAVELRSITAPTMVIAPQGDVICTPEACLALVQLVRGSTTVLRPHGGHLTGVVGPTAPTAVFAPMASWLQENALR